MEQTARAWIREQTASHPNPAVSVLQGSRGHRGPGLSSDKRSRDVPRVPGITAAGHGWGSRNRWSVLPCKRAGGCWAFVSELRALAPGSRALGPRRVSQVG